ncbi:MAG: hypothetical protein ABIJ59_19990 [Pseudomonadota bacterium]
MEKNDPTPEEIINLRGEPRTQTHNTGSVEFIPGNNEIVYQFKLKDFSSKGFGILVRKDSKVLENIKAGDILSMRYHPEKATINPVLHQTQIKHISEPEPGKHQGHMLVGLLIIE